MNRSIPLRVRITDAEATRYRAAMTKLGLDEMSTFVRWALDNSTAQVLGVAAVKPQTGSGTKPKAQRPPKVAPAPKRAPEPAQEATQPSLSALLGVPLFASESKGPQPLVTTVDEDGWV